MTTRSKSECGVPSPLTIEPARKSTVASGYLLSKISFATLTSLLRNSVFIPEQPSKSPHDRIHRERANRIPDSISRANHCCPPFGPRLVRRGKHCQLSLRFHFFSAG